MKIILTLVVLFIVAGVGLFLWTRVEAARLERIYPPVGEFSGPDGARTHYVDIPAGRADQPNVLFVHGASGNLLDQYEAFADAIRGKARAFFVDRPGYGYSERGDADDPAKQAARYLALMDALGIDRVVLVGHSLGAASVAAFAVLYPERVSGIVFLAPATHPWPGGVTWYYDVASVPIVGPWFANTLVLPVGLRAVKAGVAATFDPNPAPSDYVEKTAVPLILRPHSFAANAADVAGLNAFVTDFAPRYSEIDKPVVVITGDADDIVAPSIHSVGLEEAIEGAKLIVLPGVGHKPDYVATEQAVEAILSVAKGGG